MSDSGSNSNNSGSLAERLTDRIRREGPIPFNEWMEAALYDKQGGYYNRSDLQRWGRKGDYRTSPETSELFAATFARYFAQLFDELGQPDHWTIAECGAGDGSFAEGFLATLRTAFPKTFNATLYCLDEVSGDAVGRIKERLASFGPHVECSSLESLPVINPGIVFSNELLDAFPVHRLTKRNDELLELYVTLSPDGRFDWSTGQVSTPELLEFCRRNEIEISEGQIIEVSLEIDDWLSRVSSKLANGYLITVDYGAEATMLYDSARRQHGTLRAYSRHSFVEILERPGEHDITSTVNWAQVQSVGAALGLDTIRLERLDKFLLDTGLLEELERRVGAEVTDVRKLDLSTRAREMILPGGLASSFQVLIQKPRAEGANE
ncbi:MAG TPA: SAM-dependent methyltransferase [Pyrinomonadaceae bacterium]